MKVDGPLSRLTTKTSSIYTCVFSTVRQRESDAPLAFPKRTVQEVSLIFDFRKLVIVTRWITERCVHHCIDFSWSNQLGGYITLQQKMIVQTTLILWSMVLLVSNNLS